MTELTSGQLADLGGVKKVRYAITSMLACWHPHERPRQVISSLINDNFISFTISDSYGN